MSDRERACVEQVRARWASRKADLVRFMNARDEATQWEFSNYALAFDYVAPGTFRDQPRGYWCYQISWGGPADEIRMWGDFDLNLVRAEYWYLDWGDGASTNVTREACVRWLWNDFKDTDTLKYTHDKAMED